MNNFKVVVNGNEYEVGIEEILGNGTSIPVIKETSTSVVKEKIGVAAPVPKAAPIQEGEGSISAPMPGSITHVKANKGDIVSKGDVLLVLEAMKMENEIMAPHDGTVTEVRVQQGASVNAGDILVVLS